MSYKVYYKVNGSNIVIDSDNNNDNFFKILKELVKEDAVLKGGEDDLKETYLDLIRNVRVKVNEDKIKSLFEEEGDNKWVLGDLSFEEGNLTKVEIISESESEQGFKIVFEGDGLEKIEEGTSSGDTDETEFTLKIKYPKENKEIYHS